MRSRPLGQPLAAEAERERDRARDEERPDRLAVADRDRGREQERRREVLDQPADEVQRARDVDADLARHGSAACVVASIAPGIIAYAARMRIVVLGAGHVGRALVDALHDDHDVVVVDVDDDRLAALRERYDVRTRRGRRHDARRAARGGRRGRPTC